MKFWTIFLFFFFVKLEISKGGFPGSGVRCHRFERSGFQGEVSHIKSWLVHHPIDSQPLKKMDSPNISGT